MGVVTRTWTVHQVTVPRWLATVCLNLGFAITITTYRDEIDTADLREQVK